MSVVESSFDLSDTAAIYCDTTVWVKTVRAEVVLCCRLRPENGSAFPITWTGFKDTMEVQFFPLTKPVGMEMWEDWLELQICSINPKRIFQHFVDGTHPCLFFCFSNMTAYSWNNVQFCYTGGEEMLFFHPVQLLQQPLVTYIVNIISHLPLFALEHQLHIFCNHLSISSYIVNRLETMKMYLRINVYHVHIIKIWILQQKWSRWEE